MEEVFKNFKIEDDDKRRIENNLIRNFRRRVHEYINISEFILKLKDKGNCLALMRHYEAPTRLLDWTYSFFNAVYFALNRFDQKTGHVVWAINDKWLTEKASDILKEEFKEKKYQDLCELFKKKRDENKGNFSFKDNKLFNDTFYGNDSTEFVPIKFVHSYTPLKLHTRLISQSGLFLCPGDIKYSFKDNLMRSLKKDKEKINFFMIEILNDDNDDLEVVKEILYKLFKMGVTGANLFPDLQGFAESLNTYVAFPKILDPQHDEFKELYKDLICDIKQPPSESWWN